ncbi:MFS general substrate transporter [Laetiporus sulphureus 93-53]|uniref:MFS general substrate transporter n=1 Tax=Laetiporus sulphureus 93-53 TaxID=1314785 RepID=A0A165AU29_9APHY|nr:MFS general substrate transporter [Laetiporus sulphureus 93-53]KZS99663.1 MFS general substrate transporter [Laetiporus sulphureus 93-53]
MTRSRDEEATLAEENVNHVVLRSLEDVAEPVDPHLAPADRPDNEVLDESYVQQLEDYIHHRDHHLHKEGLHEKEKSEDFSLEPLYIEFEKGDKQDPANFSPARKQAILLTACLFSVLVASSSGSYALGFTSMTRDLNCTDFQATLGISLYCLGFGVVPLVTASFSEEFGRQPLYLCSGIGFLLFTIATAVGKNIQTILIARFFAGAFGSTGSTMVGGTVADIFSTRERGVAMASFAAAAIGATGVGCLASGWIEQNPHLEWRWIQWIHAIFTGVFVVAVPIFMKETRASVLLVRLAKKMRKETSDKRIRARIEDERASLGTLIYISCTRPIYLLLTEPVIASFTLWVGFAWGILYVMIEAIGPVFRTLHHFNAGEEGSAFITITIGAMLGLCTNVIQEKMYSKNVATRGPEARLYAPMAAAILFPIGMFIFAWSTYTQVYWIAPAIGIVLIMWALFIIYLAVFTYLADCYGTFASSALAGQSLFRNLMGMAFPMFTTQMFARLTYHWANTLFALIAVVMIPIPFVLFFKGPAIRARSKIASQVMHI